jgi:hypothetical protein
MKKLIVGLLAALAVGAAAASVLIENASARGYTCSYATTKAKGIYYTIHGADNKPKYCRVIARPGYRRVSRVAGRTYCVFAMTQMDVRMTLRATNGYAGRFLCSGLETMLSGGWHRVR